MFGQTINRRISFFFRSNKGSKNAFFLGASFFVITCFEVFQRNNMGYYDPDHA